MSSVIIIQEHLPAFRVGFYEALREELAKAEIRLALVVAPNQRNTFVRGELDWAIPVPIKRFGPFAWQSVLRLSRKYDLIVVQQEIKYAANPVLQLLAGLRKQRIAYWGHGRNFQAENPNSLPERCKNWLSIRVDWWFAYNRLSADSVREIGFPTDCITEVMNSIDTDQLRAVKNETGPEALDQLKARLGINSSNVAVYTGGLYRLKRLEFLMEAAVAIRKRIPDFHFLVIGSGPDESIVKNAAKRYPWIHPLGAKRDHEKVAYWMISKLHLMPGLVGLAVLDSLVLGVPLITTADAAHSPEIDYLESGSNGLMLPAGTDPQAYANAVADLLENEIRLMAMAQQAVKDSEQYSLARMAANFAEGIHAALRN